MYSLQHVGRVGNLLGSLLMTHGLSNMFVQAMKVQGIHIIVYPQFQLTVVELVSRLVSILPLPYS